MKAIPIWNPSPYGKKYCSAKRAAVYIAKGRAEMRPDGFLQFTVGNQLRFDERVERDREFDRAFASGRGMLMPDGTVEPVVYWNGNYPQASFPPGCNVQIERIPWRANRHVRRAA